MFRKVAIVGSTVALALAVFGIRTTQAGAAAGPPKPKGKIVCTNIDGTIASSMLTISGCSGTANVGGGTTSFTFSTLVAGGTVNWLSGKTTTFGTPVLGTKKATKCPGYVKKAATNPTLTTFSGLVTADTSGMKVPGKYKGSVCVSLDGVLSAPKPFKAN